MIDWEEIQRKLESGSYYIKDIMTEYNITRKKIYYSVKKGHLNKVTWKIKKTVPIEVREKISISRRDWLLRNPDKHPWKKNDKFLSIPCEILKNRLSIEGINFISEYSPLSDRNYSIDILIVDKLIGIEVNGNQHYDKNGKLKEYYENRKNDIEKVGLSLIDIHYSKVFDDKFLLELILFIQNKKDKLEFDFIKKDDKYCECGKKIKNSSKLCSVCYGIKQRKVDRPELCIIEKEILEIGYRGTGRKYGVSDNAIRKWLKNKIGESP